MNILYIGDIMGEPGMAVVERALPALVKKHAVDLVIAQAENVTDGKGMSPADMQRLQSNGIHFFTGGNHTPAQEDLWPALENPNQPVISPANMPESPGPGWKYVDTPAGKVLVVSLMGAKVGKSVEIHNPLAAIDRILDQNRTTKRVATVVNFHGDYSSEKRVIGYYLDGRVTAVIGDHWHVPTHDAMVLPKGTAHITDVGMCGNLHSSLGVELDIIISRWRDGIVLKNQLAAGKPWQFNAVLIGVDTQTSLATSIKPIQKYFKN